MANIFKSTREIVQSMCDEFKNITGITLSPDQIDDTTVIKMWTYAGGLSSFYAEAQKTLNEFFPASASEDSLIKHLSTRGLPGQIQPQKSHGQLTITLDAAATIPVGTQAKRKSDGVLYNCIEAGSLAGAGTLTLFFESVDTGNDKNIDDVGQPFELAVAIPNVQSACTSASKFLDGRDLETSEEMLARIQAHDKDDDTGGNDVAYERWAKEANAEVVTAKSLRHVRGLGTVDTIITSGTSDIEAAVEADQVVTRLPSSALISAVQDYVAALNPTTDDHITRAPTEDPFNVTVKYNLYSETTANRTYVDGIITKVVKTFVLTARPLDVLYPTDLERAIDKRVGDLIKERKVDNFAGAVTFFEVPADKILTPNTITLTTL